MIWPVDDDGIIESVILENEKGLVNDPADSGGITNMGVTKAALAAFRGVPVEQITDDDIINLQRTEAIALYNEDYIKKPGFDKIMSVRIRTLLVDTAVLAGAADAESELEGVEHAALHLEQVAGQPTDGVLSDADAAAANRLEPRTATNALSVMRMMHFARIVQANPVKVKFIGGWIARAGRFIE